MSFADQVLGHKRPESIRDNVVLPRRQTFFASPIDWRDETLYFLLVDRFSDGDEGSRTLLDRTKIEAARPDLPSGEPWRWDRWAQSGADRYQGGTIKGVRSKLSYLKALGVTTIWLSPVFKQRGHQNTYHGYGVQDFLDIDPRFGDRQDLVDLVDAAHAEGLRVILDIIFNHSGHNWNYPGNQTMPPYRHFPDHYQFGQWLDSDGNGVAAIGGDEHGVWPKEVQDPARYSRAGTGDLGAGDLDDPHAEHKRTDFLTLRDLRTDHPRMLDDLAQIYKYWIALTDCDGFRIDTLKHVAREEARNFCGTIKEFAANLGKQDFFLLGEVAGGSFAQDFYLDGLPRNINAVLDIGEARPTLEVVAKGLTHPNAYFGGFDRFDPGMGSHRNLGSRHISVLNDHDHVSGVKLRFTDELSFDHQVVAGVAIQLFTLGIPCIYYGTEQAFAPPEKSAQQFLPDFGGSDRYLREAMFGPRHPNKAGKQGLSPGDVDEDLPGFGPFGTAGQHCFDSNHPAFVRIAALSKLRRDFSVLRYGRQYLRPHDLEGALFVPGPGDLICWSRILDVEEALIVVNAHGTEEQSARVLIDPNLNPQGGTMTVIANTAESADPAGFSGPHRVGSAVSVEKEPDGTTFVEIDPVGPSEVLVLINHLLAEEGGLTP